MPRPKKERPNRSDSRFEVKITIGKDMHGKPIRKSFYSTLSKEDAKKQAEEWRVNQRAAEIAGIPVTDGITTFEEWALTWLRLKKDTVKGNTFSESYERPTKQYLIPYFGKASLTAIQPMHIETFFAKMSTRFAQTTLNKFRICLNAIFETAIDNDKCYKNPVKRLKPTSKKHSAEKRVYTREERDELFEACKDYADGLIIYLLLEFGLRCSELCALRWEDFDFAAKTLHVQRASVIVQGEVTVGEPKSKTSNRVLPMRTGTAEYLAAHAGSGYIFQSRNGLPYTSKTFAHVRYDPLIEEIRRDHPNIPKLTMHELRHTCGTLLYDSTKDIYAVSKYMGHSSVRVTEKYYMHEDTDMLRNHLKID